MSWWVVEGGGGVSERAETRADPHAEDRCASPETTLRDSLGTFLVIVHI